MKSSLLLLLAVIIWGFGFIATRWTFTLFSGDWSNFLRFLLASLAVTPYLVWYHKKWRKNEIMLSALGAFFLFLVMHLQTIGLELTTVSKSGFITTLYVLVTPFFAYFIDRKKVGMLFWMVVLLSLVGLALLVNLEWDNFNRGDFYTLCCAFFGGTHIYYIGKIEKKIHSIMIFSFWQIIFATLYIFLFVILFSKTSEFHLIPQMIHYPLVMAGFFCVSVLSTIVAFTIQIIAQKTVPAHVAGLLFLLEAPFATYFGWYFLNEGVSSKQILGACLLIGSVFIYQRLSSKVSVQ